VGSAVRINCPWGFTKYNYPWLMVLRTIQRRALRPVHFQFLPGGGAHPFSSLIPLLRDLGTIFEGACTLFGNREYAEYMECLEAGDVALESHPFGGYNTVVDSLYLGIPIVTREGTRFYNRAASALLRKLDLDELVATSDEEYVEKTVRLINDEPYRLGMAETIRSMDLRARIFDTDEPAYFLKAIDYLVENQDALRREDSREPIFIR
jgi:hypothetical protein